MIHKPGTVQWRLQWRVRGMIADAAAAVMQRCRRVIRATGTRCSYCGADPGFQSSVSRKGLRCVTSDRDCEKMP